MLKHGWSVICERAITDSVSRNVSMVNCLEQINSSSLPINFPACALVSYWYKEDLSSSKRDSLEIRVSLRDPDNQEKELLVKSVEVVEPRQRLTFYFSGLSFKQAGIYFLVVQYKENAKWKTVSELPLQIAYNPDMISSG